MRVKTVSVGLTHKFNLGNWESEELRADMWLEVHEEEDELTVLNYAVACIRQCIRDNADEEYLRKNPTFAKKQYFKGKEVKPDLEVVQAEIVDESNSLLSRNH